MMGIIGTCKLCHASNVELKDSHLLAKAGYKILRKSDGNSPIAVDREISLMTDSQVRGHVLCGFCEDRLNKNGENWVLRYCHRGNEGFRLKKLLEQSEPAHQSEDLTVFEAGKIPEIDVNKLAYYAVSVFWRSGVHEWRAGVGELARLNLGQRYESEFRAYLIGTGFLPQNAILWVHITDDQLVGYMSCPTGGKIESFWRYDFNLLGIGFTLWLGGEIPKSVRRMCFVRSPEHFIYSGKTVSDMITSHAGKVFSKSRPVGSLARQFEEKIIRNK